MFKLKNQEEKLFLVWKIKEIPKSKNFKKGDFILKNSDMYKEYNTLYAIFLDCRLKIRT